MTMRRDEAVEGSPAKVRGARLAKHVDEHVGERIRQRRTMLGYTQEQLAAALDISYQQVQKYETGANRVSAGRLFEVASYLGVDVGFFFDGLEPEGRHGPMPHGGRNRQTLDLVRNFTQIEDTEVRNAVSGLVKVLSGRQDANTLLITRSQGEAD
jgi:transcriptional regulator with XRE-family HTH domain